MASDKPTPLTAEEEANGRSVEYRFTSFGMARIWATLDAERAARVKAERYNETVRDNLKKIKAMVCGEGGARDTHSFDYIFVIDAKIKEQARDRDRLARENADLRGALESARRRLTMDMPSENERIRRTIAGIEAALAARGADAGRTSRE